MSHEGMRIDVTLDLGRKVKAWILVPGGWFPIHLASAEVLLVDRNVTSALKTLETNPNRPDLDADKWWLQHLDKPHPMLNPILCAMEGNQRTPPTFDEFCAELTDACEVLKRTLPRSTIVKHREEQLHSAYEPYASQAPRMQREIDFLVAICPKLTYRAPRGKSAYIEELIFQEAEHFGVPRQSFACLAALSVLHERTDGAQPRIGRGVLKPTPTYNSQEAYNALWDLHALEYLTAASALPGASVGFCTRDKYLAAFWACLGAQSWSWKGTTFTASFAPKPELFPQLTEEGFHLLLDRLDTNV